ncbi:efflux RND transporter permease subunit [Citrobacter sp.]|uniref:efflux RND transporter permease subunit n=1 Tax=Citrobacter sp. TaxID=1896336 RepID=UPI003A8739F6
MDISRQFINNPVRVWLLILLLGIGGIFALLNIGRLEDPEFAIKSAVVVTLYPGASAEQVEEEVTQPLEKALQQLPYLDNISSISSNGMSQITVNIASHYHSDKLPQIWDELRRRVGDAGRAFPPGVMQPFVNDDFGDVFGFFFSISGDNFSNKELAQYAEQLRRELVLVPGVGKVMTGGIITSQINVEVSLIKMAARGITPAQLSAALSRLNIVSNAGVIKSGTESIRIHSTGEFENLDELGHLLVSPAGDSASTRLKDIATLTRGLADSPSSIYHANGQPAVMMGVSFIPGVNVIDVGQALKSKLLQMSEEKPAGLQIGVFYDQSAEVASSVNGFLTNFLMALTIVIGILVIFMGLRSGIIIALSLALNVLGTLFIMYLWGLELQRISLGALIIALSMLVDNAIVIVEGLLISRQQGASGVKALNFIIRRSALPLLGATIIAILAFAPIGLSQDSTGEYCKSLFQVLLISLMLSWFTALTITPALVKWWLFKTESPLKQPSEFAPYSGSFYRLYQRILNTLLAHKTVTLSVMAVLLALAIWSFGSVRQNFFPSASTPIFFVDLWLPYGTDITSTEKMASDIEKIINGRPGVVSTVSTIGHGSMRFILTYNGQRQYSNYAQIMVRMDNERNIGALASQLDTVIAQDYPQVNASTNRVMFGPSGSSSIEVRIRGTAPDMMRQIASKVSTILADNRDTSSVSNDWQNRSKVIRPQYNPVLGQELGVDKKEVDDALEMNFSGSRIGLYREGTDMMPIVVRPPENERHDINHLNNVQVWSQNQQRYIPLSNVVDGFVLQWENPLILRRDRSRVMTVMTNPDPLSNATSADILARVRPQIEQIPLPHGYNITWGGDAESSSEAQQGLFSTLPLGYLVMFTITVLMFSSLKNAFAIWLTVPLALIGVTAGFLLIDIPFGFMALIGLLSLSGMLIRNGIVLVEEIEHQKQVKPQHEAIISAATSRLRPVLLTTFTTVLGFAPLLRDVFFQSMAVVVMFGLGFATILTLMVLPVIYDCLHRAETP